MRRKTPCYFCAVALAILAAAASAQDPRLAALQRARDAAAGTGARVLLWLSVGDSTTNAALRDCLTRDEEIARLLRYAYHTVALPADSAPAREVCAALALDLEAPALVLLGRDLQVLGSQDAPALTGGDGLERGAVAALLFRDVPPGAAAYHAALDDVQSGEFVAAVARLADALRDGYPAHLLPADAFLAPLRGDPDRRLELAGLIRDHVTSSHIALVDAKEHGERIRLEGRVVDRSSSEPLPNALVHLFQTDAGGEYRPGMTGGGGAGNPRLFGYLRTDDDGRFAVETIVPERYPDSTVPRHVHYRVLIEGRPEFVSECFFDDDPALTQRTRDRAAEQDMPIVELRDGVGSLVVRVPGV